MRSTSASLGGITATLRAGDAGVTTDIAVRYVQDTGTRASASSMDERAPQSCARAYMRHAFQLYLWARCALSQHAPSVRLSGHSTFDRGPSASHRHSVRMSLSLSVRYQLHLQLYFVPWYWYCGPSVELLYNLQRRHAKTQQFTIRDKSDTGLTPNTTISPAL